MFRLRCCGTNGIAPAEVPWGHSRPERLSSCTPDSSPRLDLIQVEDNIMTDEQIQPDATGSPVVADPSFTACVQLGSLRDYCTSLAQGVAGVSGHVVSASIFTTLSATAWLESARTQLQNTPIVIHRPSAPYVFSVANLST